MNRKEIEVTKETCASIVLCNIPWQLSSTTDQERALYPANHNSLARIFLARFSHRKSIDPFICPSFRISSGADPGEVKWVNFHPPFPEPPSFFFFLSLKYWNNIWFLWFLLHYYKNSPPISKSWIRACSFSSFVRLSFCSYVGSLVHSFLHSIFSSLVRRKLFSSWADYFVSS